MTISLIRSPSGNSTALFSFFNNVPEQGRVDYGMKIAEPSLPIPDSTARKYINYINQLATAQAQQVASYEQERWASGSFPAINLPDVHTKGSIPAGLQAYYPFDFIEDGTTPNEIKPTKPAKVINGVVPRQGKFSGGLDFSGENYLELGPIEGINLRGPVSISFWFYTVENGARGTILAPKGPMEGHKSGFELSSFDDGIRLSISQFTDPKKKGGGISIQTSHVLPGNKWAHVVLTYDGSNKAQGVSIYLNGQPLESIVTKDNLPRVPYLSNSVFVGKSALRDGFRATPQGLFRARLDELMLFDRVLTAKEVEGLAAFHPLQVLQQKKEKNEHEDKRLFYHYLHHHDARYQEITKWLSEYKYREMKTEHLVVKPTMVMAEMDTVRPAYILDRGLYSAPGERVHPATPKHIMTYPEALPKNRLGLAKWLFDENNPLTARVAVNRYWQMIFGRGIVGTPEDFGSQGDLPSHPELLDWLAVEFRASGWDLKTAYQIDGNFCHLQANGKSTGGVI